MIKTSKKTKIIAIIMAILIALVVMSIVILFVCQNVTSKYNHVTLALKKAEISKDEVYGALDDIEASYDNIASLINMYVDDPNSIVNDSNNLDMMADIALALSQNVDHEKLATFMYLVNSDEIESAPLDPLMSMMDYADSKRIDDIKDYKIVTSMPTLIDDAHNRAPEKMPSFKELISNKIVLSLDEWKYFTSNMHNISNNINNESRESKDEVFSIVRRMISSKDILEEIPFKDIGKVSTFTGRLLDNTSRLDTTVKLTSKALFNDKNELAKTIAESHYLIDSVVVLLQKTTIEEIAYDIGGEYPHMDRLFNSVFYTAKRKINPNIMPYLCNDIVKVAHMTIDKDKYLNEEKLSNMFKKARNIDNKDFNDEERAFWEDIANHFAPQKANADISSETI